jgi:energy-coupling factor transport system substrate-specific component
MENKLNVKNLITVGIFTALYFILFFATGIIGYIPVMMLFLPLLCPLVTGIPFMLFLTKAHTFGMVTIMGTLLGILMFITGHPWPCLVFGVLCGGISDLIFKAGNYKGWKTTVIGYVVFSEWITGTMIPLFFMRESYFATIRGYGDTYTDTLSALTPDWVLIVMVLLVIIGASAGAYLGRTVLKKHFKRAGIA